MPLQLFEDPMLDDRQDRAPFDVSTLIEGEVQALAAERTRPLPSPALRRPIPVRDILPTEAPTEDLTALAIPPAEASAAPAQPAPDYVNHPPHYTAHPSGVECITITRHMNFNRGNAIKYIWRAGDKGNEIEDLRKAAWYIADEIARLEKLRDGE